MNTTELEQLDARPSAAGFDSSFDGLPVCSYN
jgi:hypothetical protein